MAELVAAATQDYCEQAGAKMNQFRSERDQAQLDLETSETARKVAEFSSADLERVESELVAANVELDDLRGQIKGLRSMVPMAEEKPDLSEWHSLEDVENVYKKENAEGVTIYRVGWRENGKQRWKTTGPDLADALSELELVQGGRVAA